jgi:DNA-binding transcriptional ArsR family regulator
MLVKIDYDNVEIVAKVMRALKHKLRQQMIELISETPGITVTEIFVKLRLHQCIASSHLAILRKVGIVTAEKEGKLVRYKVNEEWLNRIDANLKRFISSSLLLNLNL